MRQYVTFHDTNIHGSKPTVYDISRQVVYGEDTVYDLSFMRPYTTSHSVSHRNGRVSGVYKI